MPKRKKLHPYKVALLDHSTSKVNALMECPDDYPEEVARWIEKTIKRHTKIIERIKGANK